MHSHYTRKLLKLKLRKNVHKMSNLDDEYVTFGNIFERYVGQ